MFNVKKCIMKQIQINGISEFLRGIQLGKVSDKDTKVKLAKIYLVLHKKAEEFSNDIKEFQKKFFEGKEEDIQKHDELVRQLQTAKEEEKAELEAKIDPEITESIKDFNNAVQEMLNKEVEVSFDKLSEDKLIEALIDLEIEFTGNDLSVLKDLYE